MYLQLSNTCIFLVVLLSFGTHNTASICPVGKNCGGKTSQQRLKRNTVNNIDKFTRKDVRNEVFKTGPAVQNKANFRLPEKVEIRSKLSNINYPRYSFNFNPIPTVQPLQTKVIKRLPRLHSRPTFSVRTAGTRPLFRANSQSRRFRQNKFSSASKRKDNSILNTNDKLIFNLKTQVVEKENTDLGIPLGIATGGISTRFSDKQEKSVSRIQSDRPDALNINKFNRQSNANQGKASINSLHGIEVRLGDGQIHLNSHAILSNVGKDVGVNVKNNSQLQSLDEINIIQKNDSSNSTEMALVNSVSNIVPLVNGSPTSSEKLATDATYNVKVANKPSTETPSTKTVKTVYEAPIALGLVQPSTNDAEIITRSSNTLTKSTGTTMADKSLNTVKIASPPPLMNLHPKSESTTYQIPIALGLVKPSSRDTEIHKQITVKIMSSTTFSDKQIVSTTTTPDIPPLIKPTSKRKNKHKTLERNKSASRIKDGLNFTPAQYEAPVALGLVQPSELKSTLQIKSSMKSSPTEYEVPVALGFAQSSEQSKSILLQMTTSTTAVPEISVSELGSRVNVTDKPSLYTSMPLITPTYDAPPLIGLDHLQKEKNVTNELVQLQGKATASKPKAASDHVSPTKPLPASPVVSTSGVTQSYISTTAETTTYKAPEIQNILTEGMVPSIANHKKVSEKVANNTKKSASVTLPSSSSNPIANESPVALGLIQSEPKTFEPENGQLMNKQTAPVLLVIDKSKSNAEMPPSIRSLSTSGNNKVLRYQGTIESEMKPANEIKPTDSTVATVLSKNPRSQTMENINENIAMKTIPPPVIPFSASENKVMEAPTYLGLVQSELQVSSDTDGTVIKTVLPTTHSVSGVETKRNEDKYKIKPVSHSTHSGYVHNDMNLAPYNSKPLVHKTQHEILTTTLSVPTIHSSTKIEYTNILVEKNSSNTKALNSATTIESADKYEAKSIAAYNLHNMKAQPKPMDQSKSTNIGQNMKIGRNVLTDRQKAAAYPRIYNNEILNIDSEMSVIEHKSVVISKIPSNKIKHLRDVTYNIGGLTIRPKIVKTVAEENLTIPVDLTIPDDHPEIILVAVIPNKLRNAHYSIALNEKTRPDVTVGDIVFMEASTTSSARSENTKPNTEPSAVFTSTPSNSVDTSTLNRFSGAAIDSSFKIAEVKSSTIGIQTGKQNANVSISKHRINSKVDYSTSTSSPQSNTTQMNIIRANRFVPVPATTKKDELQLPITTTPTTLSVSKIIDMKNESMFRTPLVEFKDFARNVSLATNKVVSNNISKNFSEGLQSTSPVSDPVSYLNSDKLTETKLQIISNLSKIIANGNTKSTMLEQRAPVVSGSQLMGEIEIEGEDVIDASQMMALGNPYPERTSTTNPLNGLISAVMNMDYNASKVSSSNAPLTDNKILEGISYNIGGLKVRPNILRTVSRENLTIPIDLILAGDRPEVILLALITDPVKSKKTYSITLNSSDIMSTNNGEPQNTVLSKAEVQTPTVHTNVNSPESSVTDNYTSDVKNVLSNIQKSSIESVHEQKNVTENYTGNVQNVVKSTILDMLSSSDNGNVTLPITERNAIFERENMVASTQNLPNPIETPKFSIGTTVLAKTKNENGININQHPTNNETSSHSFLTAVIGSELNATLPNITLVTESKINNILISNLSIGAPLPTKENIAPVAAKTEHSLNISPTQPGHNNLENAHITLLTADTARTSDPKSLKISKLKSSQSNTNERSSFSDTRQGSIIPPQPSFKLSSSMDASNHLTLWSAKNPVLKDETLIIQPLGDPTQNTAPTINMTIVEDKNTRAADNTYGRSVTIISKDQTTARTYMPFETSTSGEFKTNGVSLFNTYNAKTVPPVQYFTSKQSISPLATDTILVEKSSSTNPPKHTKSVDLSVMQQGGNEITTSPTAKKQTTSVGVRKVVSERIQRRKENAGSILLKNMEDELTKAAFEALCKQYTSSHVDYVSYAPYPLDCSKMVQCIDTGTAIEPVIRHCPMGLFWDQPLLMCRKPKDVPCLEDKCLVGIHNYTGHWGCRSFYTCSDAASMPKCCPEGHRFIERPDGAGDCVKDESCADNCNTLGSTMRQINKDVTDCHTLPDDKHKDMYWEITHGTLQMRACPDGTVYSKSRCTCAMHAFHTSNGRHHAGCRPEFELDFHSGRIRDISHGGLSFDHRQISPVDGYGIFRGSSRVYIWGFINRDLGDTFAIKLRIMPSKGGCMMAPESIISNCGPDGEPSVDITCHKRQIKFTTRTHGYPKAVIIAINFTEERWLDLTYTYKNNRVTGQVDDRLYHKIMGGRIEQRNNPMVIGKCPNISGFRGKVDNIAIYTTCVPEKHM